MSDTSAAVASPEDIQSAAEKVIADATPDVVVPDDAAPEPKPADKPNAKHAENTADEADAETQPGKETAPTPDDADEATAEAQDEPDEGKDAQAEPDIDTIGAQLVLGPHGYTAEDVAELAFASPDLLARLVERHSVAPTAEPAEANAEPESTGEAKPEPEKPVSIPALADVFAEDEAAALTKALDDRLAERLKGVPAADAIPTVEQLTAQVIPAVGHALREAGFFDMAKSFQRERLNNDYPELKNDADNWERVNATAKSINDRLVAMGHSPADELTVTKQAAEMVIADIRARDAARLKAKQRKAQLAPEDDLPVQRVNTRVASEDANVVAAKMAGRGASPAEVDRELRRRGLKK